MRYRVKWSRIVKQEGFVTDGDQDGNAWEGTKQAALMLASDLAELSKEDTYEVVPVED